MKERRSESRIHLQLPVVVQGKSSAGNTFIEKATIENLSGRGAFFSLESQLWEAATLQMHIDPEKSDLVTRVRVVRHQNKGVNIGVGVCIN